MALPHLYCGRSSCLSFQMDISGKKDITSNFSATAIHGSTIRSFFRSQKELTFTYEVQ